MPVYRILKRMKTLTMYLNKVTLMFENSIFDKRTESLNLFSQVMHTKASTYPFEFNFVN